MSFRSFSLVALFTFAALTFALAPTVRAEAKSPQTATPVHAMMKVPSSLGASMSIPTNVKAFLDRDFRSRYPVAAPVRVDVIHAWVETYGYSLVPDGYGGTDTRHYFRVVAQHTNGSVGFIDVYIYERSLVEADQDPILIESFKVVGWQP